MNNVDTSKWPPYMQRVAQEFSELQNRIEKLELFAATSMFQSLSETEKTLLSGQRSAMHSYMLFLSLRLGMFSESQANKPSVRCDALESGGFQCELDKGHEGRHWISQETITK